MNSSTGDLCGNESDKNKLLNTIDNPLVHYSDCFTSFLRQALKNTKVEVLESRRNGDLVGMMPVAVCTHETLGTVINSMPFFGSHGGPVAIDEMAQLELLGRIPGLIAKHKPRCATIIENPFLPLNEKELIGQGFNICDDRVGQFTPLPPSMDHFHIKTRNAIRKGQKLQQNIQLANSLEDWQWMQSVHERSISRLGGIPKTLGIFKALRDSFGASAQLWIGSIGRHRISGVVVVRYRRTVEYFTPVVDEEYRDTQALSATIYEVMQQSALKGSTCWNWGGTWRSQDGVYRFKKRWGARDYIYRYFNKICDASIKDDSIVDLTSAFSYFYLFRF
jgi:hypothetical protein